MFQAKQSSSVAEYVKQFAELVDQLKAYSQSTDPMFYTMHFIDGLRADIKAIVLVLCPKDLDTACTIALLQEEVGSVAPRIHRSGDWSSSSKAATIPRTTLPLPLPPSRPNKGNLQIQAASSSSNTKLAPIKAYHRAMGLCFKCGAKWSKERTCVLLRYCMQLKLSRILLLMIIVILSLKLQKQWLNSYVQLCPRLLLVVHQLPVMFTFVAQLLAYQSHCWQIQAALLLSSTQLQQPSFPSSDPFCSLPKFRLLVVDCCTVLEFYIQLNGQLISVHFVRISGYWIYLHLMLFWGWIGLCLLAQCILIGSNSGWQFHIRDNILCFTVWMPPFQIQFFLHLYTTEEVPSSDTFAEPLLPVVQNLVDSFADLLTQPTSLPPSRSYNHSIPLVLGAQSVFIRPYKYPPSMKDEIKRQVQDMLSQGIIQPSSSAFASPVLLVRKKDGSFHFCVDFRQLSALTAKSKFLVPVFDQLMDLRASFHQILMQPWEEFKTTFQTHLRQYVFKVMAFGLTGAPGTFQGTMNTTLAPGLCCFVIVFFDDILVYSCTPEDRLKHLALVFSWLQADQWKVKLSKCTFAKCSIAYLGHIVSEVGVATDPAKVKAITDWPAPTSVRALRGFLELASYYRKFVCNFGIIARPLNDFLKKNSLFIWTSIHASTFKALKQALSSLPVLALPDFSVPFHVETDA